MNQGQNGLAFFNRATADGRRGGAFYVNNHNLKAMTRDIVATITLHEASPGEIKRSTVETIKSNQIRHFGRSRMYIFVQTVLKDWNFPSPGAPNTFSLAV